MLGIVGSPSGSIASTPMPSSIISVAIITFNVSPLLRANTAWQWSRYNSGEPDGHNHYNSKNCNLNRGQFTRASDASGSNGSSSEN